MKYTHYIQLSANASILDYKLPFVLNENDSLSNLLPVYSYIESYEHLIDLEIDAYEFEYDGITYIVDIVLHRQENGFIIVLDDKTDHYLKEIKDQTLYNSKKIELEYAKLNQSFLVSKNKYLEFVISTMSDMLESALGRIDQSVISLNEVNTYVKEDEQILLNTMDLVKTEISYIKQSMSHMSIFKHLDPSVLLDQPEFIPLKQFIDEIAKELTTQNSVITTQIGNDVMLYGNRAFFTNLFKYYLDDNLIGENHIEFSCSNEKESLLAIKINYFANIKGFVNPQQFTQRILLPSSFEIETNSKLIEEVFYNIKKVLLNQAKILYEVAA